MTVASSPSIANFWRSLHTPASLVAKSVNINTVLINSAVTGHCEANSNRKSFELYVQCNHNKSPGTSCVYTNERLPEDDGHQAGTTGKILTTRSCSLQSHASMPDVSGNGWAKYVLFVRLKQASSPLEHATGQLPKDYNDRPKEAQRYRILTLRDNRSCPD